MTPGAHLALRHHCVHVYGAWQLDGTRIGVIALCKVLYANVVAAVTWCRGISWDSAILSRPLPRFRSLRLRPPSCARAGADAFSDRCGVWRSTRAH